MRKTIVSLILENDGKFLIEKRKQSKSTSPGTMIFPAGHVEKGETKKQAIEREMEEELGIKIYNPKLIYQADLNCEEKQTIYWFKCEKWEGTIKKEEADELLWIKPSDYGVLTHEVSKKALSAYLQDL